MKIIVTNASCSGNENLIREIKFAAFVVHPAIIEVRDSLTGIVKEISANVAWHRGQFMTNAILEETENEDKDLTAIAKACERLAGTKDSEFEIVEIEQDFGAINFEVLYEEYEEDIRREKLIVDRNSMQFFGYGEENDYEYFSHEISIDDYYAKLKEMEESKSLSSEFNSTFYCMAVSIWQITEATDYLGIESQLVADTMLKGHEALVALAETLTNKFNEKYKDVAFGQTENGQKDYVDFQKVLEDFLREELSDKKEPELTLEQEWTKTDYLETHYEMVTRIDNLDADKYPTLLDGGMEGRWELAKSWTDEFQLKYKNTNWGEELEWMDTLENFIQDKLNQNRPLMTWSNGGIVPPLGEEFELEGGVIVVRIK